MVTPTSGGLSPQPDPELLRSLGRLVRGLSSLFWGLPIALIVCVQAAKTDFFMHLGLAPAGFEKYFPYLPPAMLPPVAATGWLLFGVCQLGHFQKQERIWISALDRARLLALVNLGLSPFLYWWHARPQEMFFTIAVQVLAVSALFFLGNLNLVLHRLSAMLPDENLREETRHFATLNRLLVLGILIFGIGFFFLSRRPEWLPRISDFASRLGPDSLWIILFLALLPLAITMALIWKIKQVILDGVFGG